MTHAKPLTGLVVIEIGHSVAAPFAGGVLAQLGADVVKIEPPEGDYARAWGPPFWNGESGTFLALNCEKSSVVVDLKDAAARNDLRELILARADIVIQNLRPGAIARYELDGAALLAAKPSLIYCNINAFGHVGPMADKPGYDPLMQAFGGIMSVTGEDGRPPVRVGTSIIDMGSALWAVIGVLSALHERSRTGLGGVVDTSLYETSLAWMSMGFANFLASGAAPSRHGSGVPQIVPYQVFETSDGYLTVAAGNDNLFQRLCDAVGEPDWKTDSRYRTNQDRILNRDTLVAALQRILSARTTADWCAILDAAGVPNAIIQDLPSIVACPQAQALDIVQTPSAPGALRRMGLPLSFDGERPTITREAPACGEHNALLRKPAQASEAAA